MSGTERKSSGTVPILECADRLLHGVQVSLVVKGGNRASDTMREKIEHRATETCVELAGAEYNALDVARSEVCNLVGQVLSEISEPSAKDRGEKISASGIS